MGKSLRQVLHHLEVVTQELEELLQHSGTPVEVTWRWQGVIPTAATSQGAAVLTVWL